MKSFSAMLLVLSSGATAAAQTAAPVVRETIRPGVTYEVATSVSVAGTLPVGANRPAGQTEIRIQGSTRYREAVLEAVRTGEAKKAIRHYLEIHLDRQARGRRRRDDLRAQVRRVVLVRPGPSKVPFSPDGPLTGDEVEMLRAEIFTPALAGLLPGRVVGPGATWMASAEAVSELTAIDPIQGGSIRCTARGAEAERVRIDLRGTVNGPTEDGPARQTLEGSVWWSSTEGSIAALDLSARSEFLGPRGELVGQVVGRYRLTRRRTEPDPDLSETALAGLALDATAETTLLLYADPRVPYTFEYPRNWRVTRTLGGSQTVLHEPTGGDLVVTLHGARVNTTPERLRDEIVAWLNGQKAGIDAIAAPRSQPTRGGQAAELITIEATFPNGGPVTLLEYLLAAPPSLGRQATVAATLVRAKAPTLGPDVARMVRSLRWRAEP